MVTTYTLAGTALLPKQEFRESSRIAGDDVLERVLTAIVVPAIAKALQQAGVADPKALLSRVLGQDYGNQPEQERHLRRLFISQVLEPVGIAILHACEQIKSRQPGELLRTTIGEILGGELAAAGRALAYLEAAAAAARGSGFRVQDVALTCDARHVERVVVGVLGPVLADFCEVVWSYGCDVLLLSGRPSRMQTITDIVLAKTPVPPHRIIGMHRYRVGETYPFRDAANRIDDPKTTAAVGAALCAQADGKLANFALRTRQLAIRSTARIIGKMDNNGQIRHENEYLRDLDLDRPPRGEVGFVLHFDAVTRLGFRQLPIERWITTPLYILEFANPNDAAKLHLPLKVQISRREIDADGDIDQSAFELFRVTAVEDAEGDRQREGSVRLRLQTMHEQEGYWLDTGRLSGI